MAVPHAMLIAASAPGSIMIAGEHAVLHGAHALVGAVRERVRVALAPRADRRVVIRSALGTRDMALDALDVSAPFRFVGGALEMLAHRCPAGFDLDIAADMPPDVGLGSSAAVTVATLAALHLWCDGIPAPAPEDLHREALAVVRAIQGTASGADIAASIHGGVLHYHCLPTPAVVRRHTAFPPVALVYAGYKTLTAEVIRLVESRRAVAADGFRQLYVRMDACAGEADAAFADADWPRLSEALRRGQSLMEELGVCDAPLADIVARLRDTPGIWAAKISGSGLGDCVLALGCLPDCGIPPYRRIDTGFSEQGLTLDRSSWEHPSAMNSR